MGFLVRTLGLGSQLRKMLHLCKVSGFASCRFTAGRLKTNSALPRLPPSEPQRRPLQEPRPQSLSSSARDPGARSAGLRCSSRPILPVQVRVRGFDGARGVLSMR